MTRYEYRMMRSDIAHLADAELVTELDRMGSEGWKLVAAIPHEHHGYSKEVHFVFSRRISTGASVVSSRVVEL